MPKPLEDWNAATWLAAALGDAAFQAGYFSLVVEVLSDSMSCPGAVGNPFIHLRLGQAQYEVGNLDRAADDLMRAYMGAGDDIFARDDPKYLTFLGTRAQLNPDVSSDKKRRFGRRRS